MIRSRSRDRSRGAGFGGAALWTAANTSTEGWYDAADTSPTNIVQSGGDVSQWSDKSGNLRHLPQVSAGSQPISGSTSVAGLNTLDFSADAAFMVMPHSIWADQLSDFYFVARSELSAGEGNAFFRGVNNVYLPQADLGSASVTVFKVGTGIDSSAMQMYIDGSETPITKTRGDFSTAMITGNMELVKVINVPIGTEIDRLSFDANHFNWNGDIAEIVVVPAAISDDDDERMQGYLAWKWDGGVAGALVGALPVGHPYKDAAPLA